MVSEFSVDISRHTVNGVVYSEHQNVLISGPDGSSGMYSIDGGSTSTLREFPILIENVESGNHTISIDAFKDGEVSPYVTFKIPIFIPEPRRSRLDNLKVVMLVLVAIFIICLVIYIYKFVEVDSLRERLRNLSPSRAFNNNSTAAKKPKRSTK